jgi:hypothetical protein
VSRGKEAANDSLLLSKKETFLASVYLHGDPRIYKDFIIILVPGSGSKQLNSPLSKSLE